MKIQARPYHDHMDLVRMRELLVVGSHAQILASYMHPDCLDWATHYPPDEQTRQRNIQVWIYIDEDMPRLAAWAIFYTRKAVLFCLYTLMYIEHRYMRP